MTQNLTSSSYTYAKAIYDALVASLSDPLVPGQLQAVYYGDQNKIPVTPIAIVEPGPKTRTLAGAPYRTNIQLTAYVMIYNNMLIDAQQMYQDTDELSESVEAFLNGMTFNDIVAFSFVESNEPGYSSRGGALYRANRLTLTAQSRQILTKS